MERLFSIEAKSFRFSSKEGSSLFRLEERRKKFVGYILVSTQGSTWLIDTVEATSQEKENIAKSFREGDKALMVHGGSNKAGRYLEVSIYAEGGRKGVLWLLEDRFGWGWRWFAGELRLLIASLKGQSDAKVAESRIAASTQNVSSKLAGVGVLAGRSKIRSFVEVLQSKPCLELKDKAQGEAAKGGVVKRPAKEVPRSATASTSVRKTKASSVQGWVNRLVGLFQLGLGRVWVGLLQGLLNGPKDLTVDKRIRAVLVSLKGIKGFGLSNGQALRKIGLGFLLKPSRRTRPTCRLKSSAVMLSASSLASEDPLGASEAEPSEPVQSAGVGLSPVNTPALPSAVEATYSGGPLSPEEDVGVGSSTVARKKDEVGVGSLSEEADTSLTKTSASQARLEAPEPFDDGLQVMQIGDVVNGYAQGAAS
jgi:hypothetical protein